MKLEVGKTYITRSGLEMVISGIVYDGYIDEDTYTSTSYDPEGWGSVYYREDGGLVNIGHSHYLALVQEKVDNTIDPEELI